MDRKRKAMVAISQTLAAQAGLEMLKSGGTEPRTDGQIAVW